MYSMINKGVAPLDNGRPITAATRARAATKRRERASVNPGQHVVLRRVPPEFVERVRAHDDPIRELLGEPPPGRSALDQRQATRGAIDV